MARPKSTPALQPILDIHDDDGTMTLMTENRLPCLEEQLCFAVYSTNLAISATYKPILAQLGLTYPQYVVMLVLWKQDGISVLQLAAKVHMDAGTLSPLLKRLEAIELITRTRSAEDERRVIIHLTQQGINIGHRAHIISQSFGQVCALDEQLVNELRSQLIILRDRLLSLQENT
jgi:MarR family transcriptional regulator, organic hydroperoxide resistance regulator